MRSLDVLLVPSRWFENGPTVVHEAFAAGTPVVGTRIGAMPELIRDRDRRTVVDAGERFGDHGGDSGDRSRSRRNCGCMETGLAHAANDG